MKENRSCLHCGKCTRACDFLNKYGLDLAGLAKRPDLAYHCFLCGECTEICPVGIDGREAALSLRRDRVRAAGGKVPEKGYGALLAEKKDYMFRSYRAGGKKSVLFPGCNFPAFFPETTKHVIALLRDRADMGVVFDCCGKPLAELGMEKDENRIVENIAARLAAGGAEELVALCPNCYYYLKPRLSLPVVSVYEKLAALGLGSPIEAERISLFAPCPDRAQGTLKGHIRAFVRGEMEPLDGVQCCGWGGGAAAREPALARGFAEKLRGRPIIYTYCASCVGSLTRTGCADVRHVLPEILGMREPFPRGARSLWNRARFRFYK